MNLSTDRQTTKSTNSTDLPWPAGLSTLSTLSSVDTSVSAADFSTTNANDQPFHGSFQSLSPAGAKRRGLALGNPVDL